MEWVSVVDTSGMGVDEMGTQIEEPSGVGCGFESGFGLDQVTEVVFVDQVAFLDDVVVVDVVVVVVVDVVVVDVAYVVVDVAVAAFVAVVTKETADIHSAPVPGYHSLVKTRPIPYILVWNWESPFVRNQRSGLQYIQMASYLY